MSKQVYRLSMTPEISIAACPGELVIRGHEGDRLEVRSGDNMSTVVPSEDGGKVTVSPDGDCRVLCPAGSRLAIGTVHGNLDIRNVVGWLSADVMHGDAILRAIGPASLSKVAGDIDVRGCAGPLHAAEIAGDARVRGLESDASLGLVGGDLDALRIEGGLTATRVSGNVRLGPPFRPGTTFIVKAGGGLRLSLPRDASIQMSLKAGGRIRSTVPGLHVPDDGEWTVGLTAGAGEAKLDAGVGGTVRICPAEDEEAVRPGAVDVELPDLAGLGDVIEAQVASALANVETHLAQSLSAIDSDEIRQIYERQAERMLRRTEELARREGRRAERLAEQARLRAERAERRWRRASGQPAQPKAPTVSDEERLQILRMVESGRLSPQEASDLLAALEGR